MNYIPRVLIRRFGFVLLLGAIAAAGCSSSGKSNTSNPTTSTTNQPATRGLAGTSWTLDSYRANGKLVAASADVVASLTFRAAGRLSGSTGCNSFGGTYATSGSALTISLGNHTLVACPANLQRQEEAILKELPTVATYTMNADTLTLTDKNKNELFRYTASSGIKGSTWNVTGVNNGTGALVTTALTEKLTASFEDNGHFSTCNHMGGPYKLTGSVGLTIGPLVSTLIGCEGDVGELEAEYTTALSHATTYEISGTTLTLRDKNNATQVTAQRP